MRPLIELHRDRAAVAADGEVLAAVLGIEILPHACAPAGMDDQVRTLNVRQHRLDLGRVVVPFSQGNVEEVEVHDPFHNLAHDGDGDTHIDKDVTSEIDLAVEIDQV